MKLNLRNFSPELQSLKVLSYNYELFNTELYFNQNVNKEQPVWYID